MGQGGSDRSRVGTAGDGQPPPPPGEPLTPFLLPGPGQPPIHQQGTLVEAMEALAAQHGAGRVVVILIDMRYESDRTEVHGGKTVAESQVEVLQRAVTLGLPIFDIWINGALTGVQHEERLYFEGESNTLQELRDAMAGGQVTTFGKPYYNSFQGTSYPNRTPLGNLLEQRGVKAAVVVGSHGNICVLNTIFGTDATVWDRKGIQHSPHYSGLLERGIAVLTSRTVLVTGGQPLAQSYGVATLPPPPAPAQNTANQANNTPDLDRRGKGKKKTKTGKT